MGHRSKREVRHHRCPVCGSDWYAFLGESRKCPYRTIHNRALPKAVLHDRLAQREGQK